MIPYIGDFAEDATIYHYFNTFDSNDPAASVTLTTLIDSDLYVYKDGNTTEAVTDGATVAVNFDARTGVHLLTIDTSVHAFYAIGSDYMVMIEGATVDAGNVTAAIFTFSIENRYNAAADDLANATDGLGAIKAETALILADTAEIGTAGIGLSNIGTIATVTTLTNLPAITANWLTAAGTAADFTTEIQAGLATPTNITAATGVVLSGVTHTGAVIPTVSVLTGHTAQTADHTAGIAALPLLNEILDETLTGHVTADSVAVALKDVLADTGELQTNQGAWATATGFATPTNITAATGIVLSGVTHTGAVIPTVTTVGTTTTNTDMVAAAPTVAQIWDEAKTSHVTADSFGVAIKDILVDTNELQVDDVPTLISTLDAVVDTVKAETVLILEDTGTTLPALLPTALVGGRMDANASAIDGSAPAAVNLKSSALSIVPAICEGTPSTTVIQTDLAEATDAHYVGRIAIFTSGAAAYQASDITAYTGATGTITVTALTTAPAASDTLVII